MVIAIDPGHGGTDPGAVYNGRQEKDDVLKLAKEVGRLLENRGIDVVYTRDGDIYETPFKKAQDANSVDADYFVSFHRNSSEYPNQYSGAEVLVYSDTGVKSQLANNILKGMETAGFRNLGVDERKDLVVLRRTKMPAVLIEAGFINNDRDNATFDEEFNRLATGIADGILETLGYNTYSTTSRGKAAAYGQMEPNGAYMSDDENEQADDRDSSGRGNVINNPPPLEPENQNGIVNDTYMEYYNEMYNNGDANQGNRNNYCNCPDVLYRVQVGAYRNRDSADRLLNSLLVEEFPAFIVYDDGLYKVQVGAYRNLSNAIAMEYKLRQYRYNTYITTK